MRHRERWDLPKGTPDVVRTSVSPRCEAVTIRVGGCCAHDAVSVIDRVSPRPVPQVGAASNALVAVVLCGGHAIPIYADVYPLAEQGTAHTERGFLTRLSLIIPPASHPVLVFDAGFAIVCSSRSATSAGTSSRARVARCPSGRSTTSAHGSHRARPPLLHSVRALSSRCG